MQSSMTKMIGMISSPLLSMNYLFYFCLHFVITVNFTFQVPIGALSASYISEFSVPYYPNALMAPDGDTFEDRCNPFIGRE